MRDDRLKYCLVIYIEKNIFIDFQNKKTIQNLHNMKNCRGKLLMLQISYIVPPLFKNPGSVKGLNPYTN